MKADCLNCSRFTLAANASPGGPVGQCGDPATGRKIYDLSARNCDGLYFDPMTKQESEDLRTMANETLLRRDPDAVLIPRAACFHVRAEFIHELTRDDIDGLLLDADPGDHDTIDRLLDARANAPLTAKWVSLPAPPEFGRETGRETRNTV